MCTCSNSCGVLCASRAVGDEHAVASLPGYGVERPSVCPPHVVTRRPCLWFAHQEVLQPQPRRHVGDRLRWPQEPKRRPPRCRAAAPPPAAAPRRTEADCSDDTAADSGLLMRLCVAIYSRSTVKDCHSLRLDPYAPPDRGPVSAAGLAPRLIRAMLDSCLTPFVNVARPGRTCCWRALRRQRGHSVHAAAGTRSRMQSPA